MLLKKLMAAAVMTVGMVGVSQAALVEGTDFVVLPEAIPQLKQDKIEVLEFFGYFCIHCKNLEPTRPNIYVKAANHFVNFGTLY